MLLELNLIEVVVIMIVVWYMRLPCDRKYVAHKMNESRPKPHVRRHVQRRDDLPPLHRARGF